MDLSSNSENIVTHSSTLTTEITRLTRASEEEVERIREAALLHQQELLRQVDWSKEEEQANIAVVKIRLERDIERLVRERSGERLTDGPIHKLPIELLGYIFRCYVALDMSPWRLVKVCKIWMRTALATPRLWRHIFVTPKKQYFRMETWVVDGEKRSSLGRMQMCSTIVQLRAALHRSGAVPLEIDVDFTSSKGGSPVSSFLPLFHIIISNSVSERIEILNMANLNLWISNVPTLSIGRFPLLREVQLPKQPASWTYSLLESVCQTATQLDTVRLRCDISFELVKFPFWPLLKILELTGLGQFNAIANALLNLEELPTCPRQWPNQDTAPVTWEKIRCTNIQCHPSHLGRVTLPNLDSLVFRDTRYAREPQDTMDVYSPIAFPNLTKLDVVTTDTRWLAKASLPLLTDLKLDCNVSEEYIPDAGLVFNAIAFPALEVLTLTTRWTDSLLVEILKSLPNLTTISLNSSRYKDQEFGLVVLTQLDSHPTLICPNLVSMSLGTKSEPVCTLKKNAAPLLKRLTSQGSCVRPPSAISIALAMEFVFYTEGWRILVVLSVTADTGSLPLRSNSIYRAEDRARTSLAILTTCTTFIHRSKVLTEMSAPSNTRQHDNTEITMPDLTAEIAELIESSRLEIDRIREAALLHQADLRKQLEWSKEEQVANIEVRKIRLKRDIERLVRERSGAIVTVGPICKLPVELLSCIFRFYVALDMSPWRLAKVCKGWMQTALTTPQVWRYICVKQIMQYSASHETWVVNGEKQISITRMQVCSTIAQLRAALRRSGAIPLEINVEFQGGGSRNPLNLSLMRIILGDSVSERIEILNIGTLPLLDVLGQPDLAIGNFYHLKKIHLPNQMEDWTHALLASISSTSSRIESVRLNCEISPKLANYSFWPLIKALALRGSVQFNSISEKLLNLEEFPAYLERWPDSTTPLSTWEKVQQANIVCHPRYLDRVKLPSLESLVFKDVRYSRGAGDTMDIYSQLSYSNLTKLEVETPDIRWLSKLYSPSLTDLTISCGTYEPTDFPDGGTPIFNGHALPAVKSLKLTTGWTDSALVDTLASFPILRTLKVNPNQHKDQEFGLVLLKHLDGKEQPFICPNLARLSLGSRLYPVFTLKKNAGPLLKRLITSRKKIGKPFQELLVCWSKSIFTEEKYV